MLKISTTHFRLNRKACGQKSPLDCCYSIFHFCYPDFIIAIFDLIFSYIIIDIGYSLILLSNLITSYFQNLFPFRFSFLFKKINLKIDISMVYFMCIFFVNDFHKYLRCVKHKDVLDKS